MALLDLRIRRQVEPSDSTCSSLRLGLVASLILSVTSTVPIALGTSVSSGAEELGRMVSLTWVTWEKVLSLASTCLTVQPSRRKSGLAKSMHWKCKHNLAVATMMCSTPSYDRKRWVRRPWWKAICCCRIFLGFGMSLGLWIPCRRYCNADHEAQSVWLTFCKRLCTIGSDCWAPNCGASLLFRWAEA